MFGYVKINEPELKVKDFRKYKAYYCGLCQTLKERYGNMGQLTLTYDMTFLIILLNSLYEGTMESCQHRCKTHPLKKQPMLRNIFSEYAADMNLILSYYHLLDDWEDEKKPAALFGTAVLKRRVRKAVREYPRQSRVIRQELKKLTECEKRAEKNLDEPAGCFGRLMEELFVYKQDVWEDSLRELGFFLGKFIYILDAYDDLEKDKKEGNYNPLKEMSGQKDYEQRVREILCMMIADCTAAFERLPCLEDADLLRNILYAGVWNRYYMIQKERMEKQPETQKEKAAEMESEKDSENVRREKDEP